MSNAPLGSPFCNGLCVDIKVKLFSESFVSANIHRKQGNLNSAVTCFKFNSHTVPMSLTFVFLFIARYLMLSGYLGAVYVDIWTLQLMLNVLNA